MGANHPRPVAAWTDDAGADLATSLYQRHWGAAPSGVWAAPGRVNVIGEHVDYNAGLCLPIALPHRTFVALCMRADDQVRVVTDLPGSAPWTGTLSEVAPHAVSGWVAYAAGSAWALAQSGLPTRGFDAALVSCVPLSAGLSSSAAVGCATALALDELSEFGLGADDPGRARLAQVCVLAENEVAGAPTGGLDQAASLRARKGHALFLDCRDDSVDHVPFDLAAQDLVLLVVDTRAPHALGDGQYASRRESCERAARKLDVTSLREVTDLEEACEQLEEDVDRRRLRHVVTEINRAQRFVGLLRGGRLHDAGAVMYQSHDSLRDDYEVTCAELDVVVDSARRQGALGARMTGGGFGGSAIVLVAQSDADSMREAIHQAFIEVGLTSPGFLLATAGPGASRVR